MSYDGSESAFAGFAPAVDAAGVPIKYNDDDEDNTDWDIEHEKVMSLFAQYEADIAKYLEEQQQANGQAAPSGM
jgi:hypothetical protein